MSLGMPHEEEYEETAWGNEGVLVTAYSSADIRLCVSVCSLPLATAPPLTCSSICAPRWCPSLCSWSLQIPERGMAVSEGIPRDCRVTLPHPLAACQQRRLIEFVVIHPEACAVKARRSKEGGRRSLGQQVLAVVCRIAGAVACAEFAQLRKAPKKCSKNVATQFGHTKFTTLP